MAIFFKLLRSSLLALLVFPLYEQDLGRGTGHGHIAGTVAFDRKEFGMNSGIPFLKIADRVEVTVDLTADRISEPPVAFKE